MVKKDEKKPKWKEVWKATWEDYKSSFSNKKDILKILLYSGGLLIINILIYWCIYFWMTKNSPAPIFTPNPQAMLTQESAEYMQKLFYYGIQFLILLALWIIAALILYGYVKNSQWSHLTKNKKEKVTKTVFFTIIFGTIWAVIFFLAFGLSILIGGGLAMINVPIWIVNIITYILILFIMAFCIHLGFAAFYYHATHEKRVFAPIGKAFKSVSKFKHLWKPYLLVMMTLIMLNLVYWVITLFNPPEYLRTGLAFAVIVICFAWAKVYIVDVFRKINL